MPYDVYTTLYDSLVQPIIDYIAGIWGTKDFSCINSVQHRACRFFLGVGKYTPNVAVEGEMTMSFPQQRTWTANMFFYSARICHNILVQRREFLYK